MPSAGTQGQACGDTSINAISELDLSGGLSVADGVGAPR